MDSIINPFVFLIAACVVVLIVAAARREKKPKTPAADPRVHITTLQPVRLPDGGPQQVIHYAPGVDIPYLMRHHRGTSGGLAGRTQRNCLRVSGEIDFGAFHGQDSHIALMLRNRTDLRDEGNPDPGSPSRISLGHGVIFGQLGAGMPDYAPDAPRVWAAVAEQFDKMPGQRVLLPETQSPPLPARVWFSALSDRRGDTLELRYVLAGAGGYFFDSGVIAIDHRAPIDGDDISVAMFPLKPGTVHIGALECVWSESPLEPALPVWMEAA